MDDESRFTVIIVDAVVTVANLQKVLQQEPIAGAGSISSPDGSHHAPVPWIESYQVVTALDE
jgi:hypothetical protein